MNSPITQPLYVRFCQPLFSDLSYFTQLFQWRLVTGGGSLCPHRVIAPVNEERGISNPQPKPIPQKPPKLHQRRGEVASNLLNPELLYTKWNFCVPHWHVSTRDIVIVPAQMRIRASVWEMRGAGPNTIWRDLDVPC